MKKRLTKTEIMRDYGLTENQFSRLQDAIDTCMKSFEGKETIPNPKAHLWGLALQQLHDGKSFIFVMDVIRATGVK